MFEDENVLEWCIQNEINVNQYLFMFFLIEGSFHLPEAQSYAKRYIKKFGIFDREIVDDLIERGFIEDYNSPGQARPEFFKVRDEVIEMLKCTENQGEELWNAYPATFELHGTRYNARVAGVYGDKEKLIDAYLKKIRRSKKKHAFVMQMLEKYLKLVDSRTINSMKLSDWIANEMWNTIEEIKEEDDGIEVLQ